MKFAMTQSLVAGAAVTLLGAGVATAAPGLEPVQVRRAEAIVDTGSANVIGDLLYTLLSVTGSAELGRAIYDPRIGCDIVACEPIWFGSAR